MCYCVIQLHNPILGVGHGRIQTGDPLQTNGWQRWSDRVAFVSLAGYIANALKHA